MKIIRFASILAVFMAGIAAAPTVARPGGQSAIGSYQFSLEDGYTRYVEFDAQTQGGGAATGQMFFSDESEVTYLDLDGCGDPHETHRGFYLRASFDGLLIVDNQAVASGTVSDSSIAGLVGQRVLLTVEDNGERDKITWGIYKRVERSWTPSDGELEKDEGVGMRWVATDFEIRDDVGFEVPRDESITTQSFLLAAYTFDDLEQWAGDIRVQP